MFAGDFKKDKTAPPLQAFYDARKDEKILKWFCDRYVSAVTGRNKYNRDKEFLVVSKICSVSDEALVHVCIENNHARWSWEAQSEEDRNGEEKPVPPYTECGFKAYKYSGWNEKGIKRFNYLVGTVIPAVRKEYEAEEKVLLKIYQSEAEQRSGKRKRREVEKRKEIIAIMEDTSASESEASLQDGGSDEEI